MASSRETSPASQSLRSRSSSGSQIRMEDVTNLPPPLPPRRGTVHLTPVSHSGPYSSPSEQHMTKWAGQDPRSSSTQSLRPVESASVTDRRRLLLIYIHGHGGNETSFQSFPAHVHNLLTVTLAESHVIHTKIYPKYRPRHYLEVATNEFSAWLSPHEDEHTDVVLVGHSMGGLLAADAALLPPASPESNDAFRHRILGVVAFDVPYLGMHPGIIKAGLASLGQAKMEKPQDVRDNPGQSPISTPSIMSTDSLDSDLFSGSIQNDPNFNPRYLNDKRLSERKGHERLLYFINKHSDNLAKATKQYFNSYFEFVACLGDQPGLQRRYRRLRSLEDVDEFQGQTDENGKLLRRVRFVNYYTASTGRVKPVKTTEPEPLSPSSEMHTLSLNETHVSRESSRSPVITPRISVEEPQIDDQVNVERIADRSSLENVEPPHEETQGHGSDSILAANDPEKTEDLAKLEPFPEPMASSEQAEETEEHETQPKPPAPFDPGLYTSSETLKAAQKEYKQSVKVYERALKEREKADKEWAKEIRKKEKEAAKEQANADKAAAKALAQADKARQRQANIEEKERKKRQATMNPDMYDRHLERDRTEQVDGQTRKKQKDRKFCSLPSKDANGQRDHTWVRVFMDGVDEVEAHTTLFNITETYEKLVGDCAGRIEGWVNEDLTMRLLLSAQHDVD